MFSRLFSVLKFNFQRICLKYWHLIELDMLNSETKTACKSVHKWLKKRNFRSRNLCSIFRTWQNAIYMFKKCFLTIFSHIFSYFSAIYRDTAKPKVPRESRIKTAYQVLQLIYIINEGKWVKMHFKIGPKQFHFWGQRDENGYKINYQRS